MAANNTDKVCSKLFVEAERGGANSSALKRVDTNGVSTHRFFSAKPKF